MAEDVVAADAPEPAGPDDRWLAAVMHVAFFVLLSSSLARYLQVRSHEAAAPYVVALAGLLAALYLLGPVLGPGEPGRATHGQRLWLAVLFAVWIVLVVLAPSFGWCSVALFFTGLRSLSTRAGIVLVVVITVIVTVGQARLRLRHGFDPTMFFAPASVAAVATAVFVHSRRQAARLRNALAELVRTRGELAATERREGVLAERQRISMDIHDTIAQGMSSQQMLLQAADRLWDTDAEAAHRHVRTAGSIADHNLAEARRFVRDLAPADLADGGSLDDALTALAARECTDVLQVRFHRDGEPEAPLDPRVEAALLRIAQSALANVREHADARTAVLTLSHLDGQVVLDVADDGRGFVPQAPDGDEVRGHGLPAMRVRVARLGGTLTVESAPGEGTVVSAVVPIGAVD